VVPCFLNYNFYCRVRVGSRLRNCVFEAIVSNPKEIEYLHLPRVKFKPFLFLALNY
jgi:hypothetical protein